MNLKFNSYACFKSNIMKKLISLIFLSIAITSCGVLWEYRSINELEGMTWSASDKQIFDFEIKQDGNYEVIIILRHLHGFAMNTIPVHLNMQKDVSIVDDNYDIPIRDKTGDYLGDGGGDLWDVEHSALESIPMTTGNYKVIISQTSGSDDLDLVMEVGLMIKKVE